MVKCKKKQINTAVVCSQVMLLYVFDIQVYSQDGSVETIDGTERTAFNMVRVSAGSKSTLESFAEDHGRDDHHDRDNFASEIINHIKDQTSHSAGDDADEDETDITDGADDVEPLEVLHEMMEKYEETAETVEADSASLARQAVSDGLQGVGSDDLENDPWIDEQTKETLELEQTKTESEIAKKLLAKGVSIQGKSFRQIAEQEMAESVLAIGTFLVFITFFEGGTSGTKWLISWQIQFLLTFNIMF